MVRTATEPLPDLSERLHALVPRALAGEVESNDLMSVRNSHPGIGVRPSSGAATWKSRGRNENISTEGNIAVAPSGDGSTPTARILWVYPKPEFKAATIFIERQIESLLASGIQGRTFQLQS